MHRELVFYSCFFFPYSANDDDPLMDSFNIYMQILISQALESGFLAAIREANGKKL